MGLFFSYARSDRPKAESLARLLQRAGNEVWLDTELEGGQPWWDKVLHEVRKCDALVMLLSPASTTSVACRYERLYAMHLGKPVLPVAVEPMRTLVLPSDLAPLQVIDYSRPNESAAFHLAGSIKQLPPAPPLPYPLPAPPPIPLSYLYPIIDLLSAPKLSQDDQFAIVGKLRAAVSSANQADRELALQLLDQMEQRPELLAGVYREITALKNTVRRPRATLPPWLQGQPLVPSSGYNVSSAISPHWGMSIAALIPWLPLGLVGIAFSAQTALSNRNGDLAAAKKASSRVKIVFWIWAALWVLLILIWIISYAANSNSGYSY